MMNSENMNPLDGRPFGPGPRGKRGGRPHRGPRGQHGPQGGFGPRGDFGPRPDREERRAERGPRRGRGRAQRGDVRAAILILLDEQPMHGYQLMQSIAERSSGRWTPSPGAVYPTLSALEDEGLIALVESDGRRLASLTEAGKAHLTEQRHSWADPFAARDGEASGPDLRQPLHELMDAVRHAGATASATQREQIAATLDEARRTVYRVLAEDAGSN